MDKFEQALQNQLQLSIKNALLSQQYNVDLLHIY